MTDRRPTKVMESAKPAAAQPLPVTGHKPIRAAKKPKAKVRVVRRTQGRLRQGALMSALPAELVARIGAARRQLQCAAAVPAGVSFAANNDADTDLVDATQVAHDLVASAVNALDSVQPA